MNENANRFDHFVSELIAKHLTPEQKESLWNNGAGMQKLQQNIITILNDAKVGLPTKTISDMPIGIIPKCRITLSADTDIVKGVSTDFGLDKLKQTYEGTPSEKDIVLIKISEATNVSHAWSTVVKKVGKAKLFTQLPTPQQIDLILPHLRTLNKDVVCHYLIPVMGQKNELVLFGVTVQKLEGDTQPSHRDMEWSIYMTIDIGDDFSDTDHTKNDIRPNYGVVLVQ